MSREKSMVLEEILNQISISCDENRSCYNMIFFHII